MGGSSTTTNAMIRAGKVTVRRKKNWNKPTPVAPAPVPVDEEIPPVETDAVKLYRETRAARMPAIKRREAKILESVKKAVAEADARAHELRHRGRPKNKNRLPPLFIRKSPDALIAAVSDWHGER